MKRTILAAMFAIAIALPAQASVIFDFVQTAEGGTHEPFSGVRIQLTLSDEAAAQSSLFFHQVHSIYSLTVDEGGGIEQFGLAAIGRESYAVGGFDRLPMFRENLYVSLYATLGGLAGDIRYGSEGDTLYMQYNPTAGWWEGSFYADYMMPCGNATACTFSGYFARAVPEPATLALLALPALLLLRRRAA